MVVYCRLWGTDTNILKYNISTTTEMFSKIIEKITGIKTAKGQVIAFKNQGSYLFGS